MREYYEDGNNKLCHAVKDGNHEAILRMAREIADSENIPSDAILIPAPQHTGRAEYTLVLADEIAASTGATVYDILECKPHESLYNAKHKNHDVDLQFRLIGTVPQNRQIYFVDNVISTGRTFAAARDIIGESLKPLAYAVDSTRLEEKYHVFNFLNSENKEEITMDHDTIQRTAEGKFFPQTKEELIELVRDDDVNLGSIDTSRITDMSYLFADVNRKDFNGIEKWDTKNVESMSYMFKDCPDFNHDISDWDVSKVKDFEGMFENCLSFDQPVGKWNIKSMEHIADMFHNAREFDQLLGNWKLGKDAMEHVFTGETSFYSGHLEISNHDHIPRNEENGKYFPHEKDELLELVHDKNVYLGDIDTSRIRDMSNLFFKDDPRGYNTSFRKDFSGIETWITSNVSDMSGMFRGTAVNIDISKWDVRNVKNMNSMFREAYLFNKDISSWNIKNVEDMRHMFHGAEDFNQNLSRWNIDPSNIPDGMFERASSFYMGNLTRTGIENTNDGVSVFDKIDEEAIRMAEHGNNKEYRLRDCLWVAAMGGKSNSLENADIQDIHRHIEHLVNEIMQNEMKDNPSVTNKIRIDGVNVNVQGFDDMTVKEVRNYITLSKIQKCSSGESLTDLNISKDTEGKVALSYNIKSLPFERIRRITGYLVGSIDRWNNAKKSEEHDRVKHDIGR